MEYSARARTVLTFGAARESEGADGANEAEDLCRDHRVKLARIGIGPKQLQGFAPSDKDLLLFGAREVPVHGLVDARSLLQRESVEMHGYLPPGTPAPPEAALFSIDTQTNGYVPQKSRVVTARELERACACALPMCASACAYINNFYITSFITVIFPKRWRTTDNLVRQRLPGATGSPRLLISNSSFSGESSKSKWNKDAVLFTSICVRVSVFIPRCVVPYPCCVQGGQGQKWRHHSRGAPAGSLQW